MQAAQITTSHRERKKARTREALAEAALARFAAQGFSSTTVDEIAADAQVSRRTFFRYFPSKEAAAFAHADERIERFRQLLGRPSDERQALAALRAACSGMARDFERDREELVLQHRVIETSPALIAYERQVDARWERAIAEALMPNDRRSRAAARRARVLAAMVIGAIRAALDEWYASDGQMNLERTGHEVLDLIEHGAGRG